MLLMTFRGVPLQELILRPMALLWLACLVAAVAASLAAAEQLRAVEMVRTTEELSYALESLSTLVNVVVALVGFASALAGAGAAWAVIRLRVQVLEQQLRDKAADHASSVAELKHDLGELRSVLYERLRS